MTVATKVTCPKCHSVIAVPEKLIGKPIRCSRCQVAIAAPPIGPEPAMPLMAEPAIDIAKLLEEDESDCLIKKKKIPATSTLTKLILGLSNTPGKSSILVGVDPTWKTPIGVDVQKLKDVFAGIQEQVQHVSISPAPPISSLASSALANRTRQSLQNSVSPLLTMMGTFALSPRARQKN